MKIDVSYYREPQNQKTKIMHNAMKEIDFPNIPDNVKGTLVFTDYSDKDTVEIAEMEIASTIIDVDNPERKKQEDEKVRRKGYGRIILNEACKVADINEINLFVVTSAPGFFQKCGFPEFKEKEDKENENIFKTFFLKLFNKRKNIAKKTNDRGVFYREYNKDGVRA
ncbi:MAG: hypothetical protein H6Q69_1678 [Firmicutes bacterium]|nr:hypothetical protein [Bacillota bacterium]